MTYSKVMVDRMFMHRGPRSRSPDMPLIDHGGEFSVIELEARGFCLRDEPGDPLGVIEVFLQFFA
jgi:hypothetical protein